LEFQYVGRDITRQKQVEEELRFFSTHDSLTGLFNEAFFATELDRLDHSRMFPISIILCNVEGLERAAARKGPGAEDELIRQTAQVLKCAFRVEDILARLGDYEFGVLLPTTDNEVARKTMSRMQKCLRAQQKLEGNDEVRYTVGISTADKGQALNQALRTAEADLIQNRLD
jgi:diguanylate cyclase (GGDEF)-like protein